MTSMIEEKQILKVDRGGRVHVPQARREALLDEFERSGVSAPEFARLTGVKYPTFANWRAKRERRKAKDLPTPRPASPFFEAVVVGHAEPRCDGGLAIELPGGGRLLVSAASQVAWAAELLRLLSAGALRPC